jgi:hypothetical protein
LLDHHNGQQYFDVESRVIIVGPDIDPEIDEDESEMIGASSFNILAGVWLIFAPFILRFTDHRGIAWSTGIVGLVVALLAVIRVFGPHRIVGLSWVNATLGAWLIVSPLILGDAGVAPVVWSSVVLGTIITGLAICSTRATTRMLAH